MIKVHDDEAYEKSEIFRVILENATGGATFTESTDGGKETAICEARGMGAEGRDWVASLKNI